METKCIYLLRICVTHVSAVFLCVSQSYVKQTSEAGLLFPLKAKEFFLLADSLK